MTWLNRNGVPVKLQWHADSLWRTYITWFLCAYPGSEKYDSGVACFDSCNHANTSSLAFQIRILHETAVPVYFQNAVLMLREFIHIRIRSQCSSPWLYRVYSIPGHWGQIYQINMIGWCEIKCLRIHLFSSNFKKKTLMFPGRHPRYRVCLSWNDSHSQTVCPFQHEPQYCSTTNPTVKTNVGHWKASQSQFVPPKKPPNNPSSNNVEPFVEQSNPWTETIHPSLVSTLKKTSLILVIPPHPGSQWMLFLGFSYLAPVIQIE